MRYSRSRPPLWFLVLVAAALACAIRWLDAGAGGLDGTPGHGPQVQQAFLGFLILIGSLIWKGLEVAGRVTLEVLKWVVVNLSLVVTKIGNGLKALGAGVLQGLKRAWDFTRRVYDDVLKPAWSKFWGLFDKLRRWLDTTFGPVLEWLKAVRDNFLLFYNTWVRPWLDFIDVTRKVLRVLAAMGLQWARALDARLGRLEQQIEAPFRFVLAKINEVINLVNRIVTLDGLIQRLVLIRSLARDYEYAWRAITQPYSRLLERKDRDAMNKALAAALIAAGFPEALALAIIAAGVVPTPAPTIESNARAYLRTRTGTNAPLLDEMTLVWRNALRRRS